MTCAVPAGTRLDFLMLPRHSRAGLCCFESTRNAVPSDKKCLHNSIFWITEMGNCAFLFPSESGLSGGKGHEILQLFDFFVICFHLRSSEYKF